MANPFLLPSKDKKSSTDVLVPSDIPRTKPAPYSAARTLTAAATRINLEDKRDIDQFRRRSATRQWQSEAYEYFDIIGEIGYAFTMLGNLTSRCRVFPAVIVDPFEPPTPISEVSTLPEGLSEAATRAMSRLTSAHGGLPGILRDAAINLSVTGECYLSQTPAKIASKIPESWDIRSVDEISIDGVGNVMLNTRKGLPGSQAERIPPTAFLGRIWRPHPRFSDEAYSSMLGVLDQCNEMLLINRTFRATARSRLNAGMLYMPDGLSVSMTVATDVTALGGEPDDPTSIPISVNDGFTDADEMAFEEELIDHMSTPVTDEESVAAVVPLVIRGAADLGDKIKQFKFERSFDPALATRNDRLLERILQGLDVPKDLVTGLANVRYCASEDTEILTKRGWLTHDQLVPGDIAFTLNHETGLSEWQSVQKVNRFSVENEVMLSMETSTHSSLTTMDHSWPIVKSGRRVADGTRRRFTTSGAGFSTSDRIPVAAPLTSLPVEQKYTDAFVELVAWFYTEGSVYNRDTITKAGLPRRRWIQITQSDRVNPQHVLRIRQALTSLFGPARPQKSGEKPITTPCWSEGRDKDQVVFMLNNEASDQFFSVCPDRDKVVNPDFVHDLTNAQLELFIAASIWADGSQSIGTNRAKIYQKVPARLDALELACLLTGKAVRRWKSTRDKNNGYGEWLFIKAKNVIQPTRNASDPKNTVLYTGTVWCPTTENHTWLARRNGTSYFTGNSNAVTIDENLYKAHIEPLIMLICDSITVIYLRQALIAEGFSREDVKNIVLWYDPSEIVTHPDRAQAANDLYDRNEISGKALRRAHGFSEGDAPEYNEIVLRTIMARGQVPPELTQAAMRYLAPTLFSTMRAQEQTANGGTGLPAEVEQALGSPPAASGTPSNPGPNPGDVDGGRPPQTTPRPAPATQAPASPNGTMPPRV